MSLLGKILNKKPSAYAIAVVQYERDDFSVGHEEQLHWAIAAVISVKNQFEIEVHGWQIIDRIYSDGRPKEWLLHYRGDAQLHKTFKCLGGVNIGQIEGKDIEKLNQVSLAEEAASVSEAQRLINPPAAHPQLRAAETQVRGMELQGLGHGGDQQYPHSEWMGGRQDLDAGIAAAVSS